MKGVLFTPTNAFDLRQIADSGHVNANLKL